MKLLSTFLFALLLLHVGSCIPMDFEDEYSSGDITESEEESSHSSSDLNNDDPSDDDSSDDDSSASPRSIPLSRPASSASSSLPEGSSWRRLLGGGAQFSNSKPSFWKSVGDYNTQPPSSSFTGSAASVSSADNQFGNPITNNYTFDPIPQHESQSSSKNFAHSMASGYHSPNKVPKKYNYKLFKKLFKLRRKHFFAGIASLAVVGGAVYYFTSVASVPEEDQSASDNQLDTSKIDQNNATC